MKGIFWDFDGTLVYPNHSFAESLDQAFHTYGYSIQQEWIREFLAESSSWNRPEKEYTTRTGEVWWTDLLSALAEFCKAVHVREQDIWFICKSFRANVINYKYKKYEDAELVLTECKKRGYKNYILSNNFPELTKVIKRFQWEHLFTDVYLSANIGYEKPRVEIFRYAVGKLDDPETLFMVGDNPVADIKGAGAARIDTIWVHGKTSQSCDAAYICNSLTDILTII